MPTVNEPSIIARNQTHTSKVDRGIKRFTFGSTLARWLLNMIVLIATLLFGVYWGTSGDYQKTLSYFKEKTNTSTHEAKATLIHKTFEKLSSIDANSDLNKQLSPKLIITKHNKILNKIKLRDKKIRIRERKMDDLLTIVRNYETMLKDQKRSSDIIIKYYEGECR